MTYHAPVMLIPSNPSFTCKTGNGVYITFFSYLFQKEKMLVLARWGGSNVNPQYMR